MNKLRILYPKNWTTNELIVIKVYCEALFSESLYHTKTCLAADESLLEDIYKQTFVTCDIVIILTYHIGAITNFID